MLLQNRHSPLFRGMPPQEISEQITLAGPAAYAGPEKNIEEFHK
jgi:hypothetical protein